MIGAAGPWSSAAVPAWPRPLEIPACAAAALATAPPQDADLAGAVRKIASGLTATERALFSLPEYAEVIGARIALECALAEGARLFTEAPAVDGAAVDALASAAETAAQRLQALEEKARAAREVEQLRLFASASAALHRELQAFRDLAARLKAAKAIPRSIALDPAAVRPGAPPSAAPPRAARLRLSDLRGFDFREAPRARMAVLGLLCALFAAATVRALFFTAPDVEELAPTSAEIADVRVSGSAAAVRVHRGLGPGALQQLLEALRARDVTSAAIILEDGRGGGQLDVKTGKLYGAAAPDAGPR